MNPAVSALQIIPAGFYAIFGHRFFPVQLVH